MYIWKNRSGYASRNFSVKVELPTSPSMATTSGHAPSAASASPNATRVATFMPISYLGRASGRRSRGAAAAGRAGRGGVSTRWSLTPPSARTAASATSSFSGLPCQPTASSTSGTPLPLTVRASTTVGSCERAASDEGVVDLLEVVPVDDDGAAAERLDAPAVRLQVPLQLGRPRLPEPVHVDDHREVVQLVVRRLVEGLPDRALGHLAVPAEHPDAEAGLVEPLAGQRDADAVGQPLPERAGGDVDPGERRRRVALQPRPRPPVGLHQLAVVDRRRRPCRGSRGAARRVPWRRSGGRCRGGPAGSSRSAGAGRTARP